MMKLSYTLLALSVVLIAVSCGGGTSTNSGVAKVEFSGNYELSTNPQKTSSRFAAANLTATAIDVDTGEVYAVTLGSGTYRVEFTRNTNLRIEIKREGQTVLSRSFLKTTTLNSDASLRMNVITHLQDQMVQRGLANGAFQDYSDAHSLTKKNIFGKESVSESDLTMSSIVNQNVNVAAVLTSYAKLLQSDTSTEVEEAIVSMQSVFSVTDASIVVGNYQSVVSGSGIGVARVFASVHEAVKQEKVVSVDAFLSLENGFTSENIKAAILEKKTAPVFLSDTDSLRTAAPGVVFRYTFPAATTDDILGVSGYSGSWNQTPSGPYRVTNGGRTITWIPGVSDVGQTLSYTLKATGVNAKESDGKTITIPIKSVQIKGLSRKMLSDGMPISDIVASSDYLYLVTQHTDNLFLEKYPLSQVEGSGVDTVLSGDRWAVSSVMSPVKDIMLYNNSVYISGGNFIAKYPSQWSGLSLSVPSAATYLASANAEKISAHGDYIMGGFVRNGGNLLTVNRYDLNLENTLDVSEDYDPSANILSFSTLGSDYAYMVKDLSGYIYQLDAQARSALLSEFTATSGSSYVEDDADLSSKSFYEYTSNTFLGYRLHTGSVLTSSILPTSITGRGRVLNATYMFKVNSSDSAIVGQSLYGQASSVTESADGTDYPLLYNNVFSGIKFGIRNVPEGISSGKSGSYLYSTGQMSTAFSASWYIKTHRLEPTD